MSLLTVQILLVLFEARFWGCRLAWSRLLASGARDPGSNPGSPTICFLCAKAFWVANYSLLFHHHGNRGTSVLRAFKSDLQLLSRYKQLFPLSFAVFISMLGFGLVMPLLPIYARNFGATGTQLGFLTASFAITRTLTTFPGGWLADKAGRKKPVVTGLLAYSIVMTLYGFTQDINQLIMLRALQGMASGIVWPVISTMVADLTSPQDRGKAMGLYQTAWFSGNVLGPSIGGVVASMFSLAAPFFICGGLAFVTMFLIVFTVQETAEAIPKEGTEETRTKLGSAPRRHATLSRSRLHGLTPYPRVFTGYASWASPSPSLTP